MAIILKLQVWIGVLLATVVITLLLYMAEATYRYIPSRDAGNDESMRAIPSYVLGVILNQGNVIFKCHLQHVKLTKCIINQEATARAKGMPFGCLLRVGVWHPSPLSTPTILY